jgi:hypothetical protein
MGPTLVQRLVGDVLVVVRSATLPVAYEVDDQIHKAVSLLGRTRVVLVALVGDGREFEFDFELRAKLCRAGLFSKPHALLAPPIRPEAVVTLKWLGAEIRSFDPDALDEACDWLGIASSFRPAVCEALYALKGQVAPPANESRSAPRTRSSGRRDLRLDRTRGLG